MINSEKIFLWCYSEKNEDEALSAYPYHIYQLNGHGIAWGRWLWNTKKWLKVNGIKGVNYHKLGVLPKWAVHLRWKYLYRVEKEPAKGFARLVQWIYRQIDRVEKALAQLRVNGFKEGIKKIKKKMK